MAAAKSFLLSHPPAARRPLPTDRAALQALLTRLHEAGVRLADLGPDQVPFGMDGAAAVVTDPFRLRLTRRLSARQARRDFARLDAMFGAGDE
jgi:hypothetical protein